MSIMRTDGGPPHHRRWRVTMIAAVTAAMTVPAALALPAAAPAAETTIANNLSFPTIWAEGITLSPPGTYGSPVFTTPTTITTDTGDLTLYLQGVEGNTWQAENVIAAVPVNVSQVDWGDNMESRTLSLTSPIRVETTLLENLVTPMSGFTMFSAGGTKDTEQFGTDTTVYPSTQADIYSGCARLTIQRLEVSRTDPYLSRLKWDAVNGQWTGTGLVASPIVNSGVWSGGGENGGYGAEINGSGKVVYGYNWSPSGLTAGDYRVTFSLDPNCPVATLNTFMTPDTTVLTSTETATTGLLPAAGSGGGSGGSGGGAVAKIDSADNLSYIDVELGTPTYTPYVPPLPVNTALPTISGSPTEGQVLTSANGTWNDATSFTYQWQSCDSAGAGCTNIAGANGASYTLTGADVGHTARVLVTGVNQDGSSTAASATSQMVKSLKQIQAEMRGKPRITMHLQWVSGNRLHIWGDVSPARMGQRLLLQLRTRSGWRTAATVILRRGNQQSSLYSVTLSRMTAGIYRAYMAEDSNNLAGNSSSLRAHGQARITMHLLHDAKGHTSLTGTVSPPRAGRSLIIQVRTPTGWRKVGVVRLHPSTRTSSRYAFKVSGLKPGVYRAYYRGDSQYRAGGSGTVKAR